MGANLYGAICFKYAGMSSANNVYKHYHRKAKVFFARLDREELVGP